MGDQQSTLTAVLQLRDDMSAGLKSATDALAKMNQQLANVGKTAQQALGGMQSSVNPLKDGFNQASGALSSFSASSDRAGATLARMGARLLALHTVTATLADAFGANSKLGSGVKVVHDSLLSFASVAVSMPGPIGLAVGALVGLGVAYAGVKKANDDATKAAAEFTAKLQKQIDAVNAARGAFKASVMTAQNPALVENENGQKNVQEALGRMIAARDSARVAMAQAGNPLSVEFLKAKETAADAQEQIDKLLKTLGDLRNESDQLKLAEKLKEMGDESDAVHDLVMAGVMTPLQGAEERLRAIESAIRDLVKMKGSLSPEDFENKLADLIKQGDYQKQIIDADKLQRELDKIKENLKAWSESTGIVLSDAAQNQLAAIGQKSQKEMALALEQIKRTVEADPFQGMELALADLSKQTFSFRDAWNQTFRDIETGISDALAQAISGAKSFSAAFQGIAQTLKRDLIKMFTDFATSSIFGTGGGLLAALFGGGAANANVATVAPGTVNGQATATAAAGGGNAMQSLTGGGVNLVGSISSGLGLSTGTLGAVAGLGAAGAALTSSGLSSGNVTQSTAGGILAGASAGALIGSVIPGIGTLIGGAVGAIAGGLAGYFGGRSKKRRQQREARARAAAAAAAYQAALAKARTVLKADIRNKMGGGLATEDAASDYGHLLSGDLSADEIAAFGDPSQIAANAAAVQKQTNVSAPITLNATIQGSYDVQVLASELAYHLANQMGGAAGTP